MTDDPQQQPSQEELRARLERQLDDADIDDVIVQVAVDLLNLAARRLGLGPQRPDGPPPDLAQASAGIEAVRSLVAIVGERQAEKVRPLRDALSQLQMQYARASGEQAKAAAAAPASGAQEPPSKSGEPGPAQRSGRLWVPGQ